MTPDERAEMRLRSADARAAAKAATERYAAVLLESQRRIVQSREVREHVESARQELCDTVSRYAVLLKQLETPPERTLCLVKGMVDESTRRSADRINVMNEAVRSCIEGYYGDAPAA
jgi:hypothetical protein